MIHMIALFNDVEILCAEIDREIQVILEILPDSFKQFRPNYIMNKLMMSLPELMKEHQMIEGILKDI